MSYSQEDTAAQTAADKKAQADAVNGVKAKLGGAAPIFGTALDKGAAQAQAASTGHSAGPYGYDDPGAANYGGPGNSDGQSAASWYADQANGHRWDNDAQQISNGNALNNSLANMRGPGAQSVEDATLSKRVAGSREQQLRALALDRQAAQGGAPSAAAFQTSQGMNDIMGSRAGALGSAHGLAGLSGAQMGTAGAAGGMAGNVATAGGMGRSKEINDAIGMYGSNAGAVRQQDIQRLGLSDQNSKFNAQNDTSWQLGNASLAAQQAQLGVAQGATDAGWIAAAQHPGEMQFGFDQQMAAAANGANVDAAAAQIAANRESADHTKSLIQGGTTAALGAVGSLAGPAGTAGGAAVGTGINAATNDWWK